MPRYIEKETIEFTLKSPLTEEEFNLISDAEFEHTDRIWFDTPKGKHVEFVKAQQWIPCSERLPEYNVSVLTWDGYAFCIEKRIPYIRDEDGFQIEGDYWVATRIKLIDKLMKANGEEGLL